MFFSKSCHFSKIDFMLDNKDLANRIIELTMHPIMSQWDETRNHQEKPQQVQNHTAVA